VSVITVTPIATMGHTEHAFDSPYGAANTGADRTSDDAADGACDAVSFTCPLMRAPNEALGLARTGSCEQDEQRCRNDRYRRAGSSHRGPESHFVHF